MDEQFDRARGHLLAVAFRMLGSADDAEDAVQETWLRASRARDTVVDNMTGWLTTIVSRICLDQLKARRRRHEYLTGSPETGPAATESPEDGAVLADSVGLALLVVLDRLTPPERVAFVLHDLFAVPYAEIAGILERREDATKQLASRARRKVRGTPPPEPDLARQRAVVTAFLAAARAGDLDALLTVLAPDVVRRAGGTVLRGARPIAEETAGNAARARWAALALVNGTVGAVVAPAGRLEVVLEIVTSRDRITAINVLQDAENLAAL